MAELIPAGWMTDPKRPDRLRYWDGNQWTEHVIENGVQTHDPLDVYRGLRWQYAVVNIGLLNTAERLQVILGSAGSQGWELVMVMDKASNWLNALEKGFMLLKRPVQPDAILRDDQWCINISVTTAAQFADQIR